MNKKSLRAGDFLVHMREAGERILRYTSGKSESDFLADSMLQDAVVRNIEILGEAARNVLEVLPDAAVRFPGIPFAAIYATRNHLSHGYFSTNVQRVWNVVVQDVPGLLQEVEAAIASWSVTVTPPTP